MAYYLTRIPPTRHHSAGNITIVWLGNSVHQAITRFDNFFYHLLALLKLYMAGNKVMLPQGNKLVSNQNQTRFEYGM